MMRCDAVRCDAMRDSEFLGEKSRPGLAQKNGPTAAGLQSACKAARALGIPLHTTTYCSTTRVAYSQASPPLGAPVGFMKVPLGEGDALWREG